MTYRRSWYERGGCVLSLAVFGIVLFFAFIAVSAQVFKSYQCDWKFEGASVPHRYVWFSGCQVQDSNAGWIPAENYRVF